jgi:hypothetical protein
MYTKVHTFCKNFSARLRYIHAPSNKTTTYFEKSPYSTKMMFGFLYGKSLPMVCVKKSETFFVRLHGDETMFVLGCRKQLFCCKASMCHWWTFAGLAVRKPSIISIREQVGNLSEHARAKWATQFRGIHATRVYKKTQLCKHCQMFGTK